MKPEMISIEERIKNAQDKIPSDIQSVEARICALGEMTLGTFFGICTKEYLEELQCYVDVDENTTYKEMAVLIDELFQNPVRKRSAAAALQCLVEPFGVAHEVHKKIEKREENE